MMSSRTKRGALLVFEGLDKVGKSTQSKLLVQSLKQMGKEAELIHFPDRSTVIGQLINEYLLNKCELNDRAIHLLFSANRFEKLDKIEKLLLSGVNVVIDRYSYSGIAYSAAKKIEGMDLNWCKRLESGLPAPDITYFLQLPLDEIKKRSGFGEERYEKIGFQAKVLMEYEKLSKECNFTYINAKDSIDAIQDIILQHSLKIINNVETREVQMLRFH